MGPNYMRPGLGMVVDVTPAITLHCGPSQSITASAMTCLTRLPPRENRLRISPFFQKVGVEKDMPCVILGSGFKPNPMKTALLHYWLAIT